MLPSIVGWNSHHDDGQCSQYASIWTMSSLTYPVLPASYETPAFPSLYWPINPPGSAYYLVYIKDIWRFTLYWTLIVYEAVHLATSCWAVLMHLRGSFVKNNESNGATSSIRWIWLVPVVFCLIGAVEALMAGSLVGLV